MTKKTFLAIALLGSLFACESEKDIPADDMLLAGDCAGYNSRETVETVSKVEGLVVLTKVGEETQARIYKPDKAGSRYCACNLPASFSKDNLRIVFSAELKKTYPNEKWGCIPMVLTSISSVSGQGTSK